ncbi:hypothetical protein AMTR_s00136p00099440 [Amborella trichopoda]|uniref:Leucine-rich repeat-containing N-terminal plant-type domain-containing protein n=1 Tax=Amborella trichopoda TaxID=13333 RepID=W1NE17_AMBTC|nr:hypothetical protein AMTR_s00136p00099440 [Amborella trichopoda]
MISRRNGASKSYSESQSNAHIKPWDFKSLHTPFNTINKRRRFMFTLGAWDGWRLGHGAIIDLSSNLFNGPILILVPEETSHLQWETWKRLFVLDLSGNVLSGNIPPSLGNCSSMQFLNLNDNDLFGSLPCSLVALENLNSVELSNNWFSGEFPQALKNWSSLSTLDLSGNEFAGNIPS